MTGGEGDEERQDDVDGVGGELGSSAVREGELEIRLTFWPSFTLLAI